MTNHHISKYGCQSFHISHSKEIVVVAVVETSDYDNPSKSHTMNEKTTFCSWQCIFISVQKYVSDVGYKTTEIL